MVITNTEWVLTKESFWYKHVFFNVQVLREWTSSVSFSMVLTLLKVFLKLQYFFKKKILVKITGFYFSEEAQDKSFLVHLSFQLWSNWPFINISCFRVLGGSLKMVKKYLMNTRLSYYNVTTRLVYLVGLCWFKQNLAQQIC